MGAPFFGRENMTVKPRCTVKSTLAALQDGAVLHLTFEYGKPIWTLSTREKIPAEVATQVIGLPQIAAFDTGLFSDSPPQSFRHVNASESNMTEEIKR
jgi:hypothetical protein